MPKNNYQFQNNAEEKIEVNLFNKYLMRESVLMESHLFILICYSILYFSYKVKHYSWQFG